MIANNLICNRRLFQRSTSFPTKEKDLQVAFTDKYLLLSLFFLFVICQIVLLCSSLTICQRTGQHRVCILTNKALDAFTSIYQSLIHFVSYKSYFRSCKYFLSCRLLPKRITICAEQDCFLIQSMTRYFNFNSELSSEPLFHFIFIFCTTLSSTLSSVSVSDTVCTPDTVLRPDSVRDALLSWDYFTLTLRRMVSHLLPRARSPVPFLHVVPHKEVFLCLCDCLEANIILPMNVTQPIWIRGCNSGLIFAPPMKHEHSYFHCFPSNKAIRCCRTISDNIIMSFYSYSDMTFFRFLKKRSN